MVSGITCTSISIMGVLDKSLGCYFVNTKASCKDECFESCSAIVRELEVQVGFARSRNDGSFYKIRLEFLYLKATMYRKATKG